MELIAELMSSMLWFIIKLEPLITILISIATLVAVMYGFHKYNEHSKSLEKIQKYSELRQHYENLDIHNKIKSLFDSYDKNASKYIGLYSCYIQCPKNEFTDDEIQILDSKNFKDFLGSLREILHLYNDFLEFTNCFEIESNVYRRLIYPDIIDLRDYMDGIGEYLKPLKRSEEGSTIIYGFELVSFEKSLTINYFNLLDVSVKHYNELMEKIVETR